MRGKRLSKRANKKMFRRDAGRVLAFNIPGRVMMRGGPRF